MFEVTMPKFGLTMEVGTITRWYKKEGDPVKKGEDLFEVETEKIVNDAQSMYNGFLKKILVKEGEQAAVGAVVAYVAENEGELKEAGTPKEETTKEEKKVEVKEEKVVREPMPSEHANASPLAKRLAKEKGIDLSLVKGTGPNGRITEQDVLNFANNSISTPLAEEGTKEALSPMRKEISERLSKSYHASVLVTNSTKIDMTEFFKLKAAFNEKISVTAMLVKCVSAVLKKMPEFNSHFDGTTITKFQKINIGVAVDTDYGLVVPVIKEVESLTLSEVNRKLEEISNSARNKKLTEADLSGSHFTITNLGMLRTDIFTPVLNGNEVAILGVGRTLKELVVMENDTLAIRQVCNFSLSYDHRIIDGAKAARFLSELASIIEVPNNVSKVVK